jgi:hypothetical protein
VTFQAVALSIVSPVAVAGESLRRRLNAARPPEFSADVVNKRLRSIRIGAPRRVGDL